MTRFSQKLTEELDRWHLLRHPFYQAWMKGELGRERLQAYAERYYPHVLAFPRYVSAVHSLCEEPAARAELARNLADEEGVNGVPHPELWLRFAEGLGLPRAQVERAPASPAARAVVDTFFGFCRSSYPEGLAALFAYERQIPEIARSKAEGLARHYGIDSDRALAFFRVHEQADLYHSEACARALDALQPEEQGRVRTAALTSAGALWDFLTEAYAAAA